jgi:aminoglycoside phosphotransferase (APT) family kinase protein
LARDARTTVKPDIAVSPAQAQTIVNRLGAGQTVAQISKLQGGAIGAIYEIGLVGGAPSLVLKVYPESLHWKMQKEVDVCALLSGRLGVPVPRVLLADDTKSVIGLNFVLMNKLDGVVLRGLEPGLVAGEMFAAYSQMGEVLRQIHRISMPSFGYIAPTAGIGRKPSIFIGCTPPWSSGAGWLKSAIANRLPVSLKTCG